MGKLAKALRAFVGAFREGAREARERGQGSPTTGRARGSSKLEAQSHAPTRSIATPSPPDPSSVEVPEGQSVLEREAEIKASRLPRADVEQLVSQAEEAIIKGQRQEGVESLRRALHLDANVANRVYNIAFALHGGATQRNHAAGGNKLYYSAGLLELDSAIAVMEVLAEPPYERADVWYQLGLYLDHRCHFDRAIAAYLRALELEPDGPDACDALNNLGILYWNRGRGALGRKGAQATGGDFVVYSPDNADYDKAVEIFLKVISAGEKAMAKDPSCRGAVINAHRLLRNIYTDRLQDTKALEHCLRMYRLAPEDEDAIQWLRQAEKNTGKRLLELEDTGKTEVRATGSARQPTAPAESNHGSPGMPPPAGAVGVAQKEIALTLDRIIAVIVVAAGLPDTDVDIQWLKQRSGKDLFTEANPSLAKAIFSDERITFQAGCTLTDPAHIKSGDLVTAALRMLDSTGDVGLIAQHGEYVVIMPSGRQMKLYGVIAISFRAVERPVVLMSLSTHLAPGQLIRVR